MTEKQVKVAIPVCCFSDLASSLLPSAEFSGKMLVMIITFADGRKEVRKIILRL